MSDFEFTLIGAALAITYLVVKAIQDIFGKAGDR